MPHQGDGRKHADEQKSQAKINVIALSIEDGWFGKFVSWDLDRGRRLDGLTPFHKGGCFVLPLGPPLLFKLLLLEPLLIFSSMDLLPVIDLLGMLFESGKFRLTR